LGPNLDFGPISGPRGRNPDFWGGFLGAPTILARAGLGLGAPPAIFGSRTPPDLGSSPTELCMSIRKHFWEAPRFGPCWPWVFILARRFHFGLKDAPFWPVLALYFFRSPYFFINVTMRNTPSRPFLGWAKKWLSKKCSHCNIYGFYWVPGFGPRIPCSVRRSRHFGPSRAKNWRPYPRFGILASKAPPFWPVLALCFHGPNKIHKCYNENAFCSATFSFFGQIWATRGQNEKWPTSICPHCNICGFYWVRDLGPRIPCSVRRSRHFGPSRAKFCMSIRKRPILARHEPK